MKESNQFELAKSFLSQLRTPDAEQLRTVVMEDVVWTFPGKASISSEARGVEGVMARAKVIAAHQVKVEILRAVYGFSGLAVILHNTSSRQGRILDETRPTRILRRPLLEPKWQHDLPIAVNRLVSEGDVRVQTPG